MKTLSFIFLLFFLATGSQTDESSSGNYLQIKTENTNVSYPPQTVFELYNDEGILLYNQDNFPELYTIKSPHKLVLHPSWKQEDEVYLLDQATLIMRHHDSELWIKSNHKSDQPNSANVKATKQLLRSLTNEGLYNLELTFTNGLVFNYIDGETNAVLNDQTLAIKGRYVIESELGIYKISFNPENGETWWVFEPKKQ